MKQLPINLKQAFRNLQRNKIYTVVNLAGLGIATAFIILVSLFIHHALQIDRYSTRTKNIHRIELTDLFNVSTSKPQTGFFDRLAQSATERYQVATPLILAQELKKTFPEIKDVTRFQKSWSPVVRVNNQSFKEEGKNVAQVDGNFFSFLDLSLVQGNRAKPFATKNSVVITERAAKKYFGNANPVGQVLSIKEFQEQQFTVSAVAKDFPAESSLQFDILTLNEAAPRYESQMASGTNSMSVITLIELMPEANLAAFEKKVNDFGTTFFKDHVRDMQTFSEQAREGNFRVQTRPLRECYFNVSDWPYFTDVKSIYQLLLLALIALGIGCLNYVLLSLSRVAARSQEAGIRKTLGAGWKEMVRLFLTETALLVSLSLLLGFIIAIIALPYFNSLTGVALHTRELFHPDIFLLLIALTLLLTLSAGLYPALKMAGIRPLNMLRKFSTYKISPRLSKVFITLQYTACLVLIVFAAVIAKQMHHIYTKDLGFDKEQVVLLQNPFRFDNDKTLELRGRLYNYAASQPSFAAYSATGARYGFADNMNGHIIDGKREYVTEMFVDYDYFGFNKIPIVKGRAFSPQFKIDTSRQNFPQEALDSTSSRTMSNIVVNETLYNLLGQPPLGEINRAMGSIIVGVCRDYYYMGVNKKIDPAYHVCRPAFAGFFLLKVTQGQSMVAALEKLKPEWDKMTANQPFSFTIMDEDVRKVYDSYQRWTKVISSAAWLAIFIACLGLFGLSAVTAVNKTKEVGIRKVLGASLGQLFYSLNKGTLLMVLLSIGIAIPIAITISNNWLQDFASRIELHWSLFLFAGLVGVVCALAAVSFHTLRAANANPVDRLRSE